MADWSRRFDDPMSLPDGGELRTLLDDALRKDHQSGCPPHCDELWPL
jgi:hypothetical protein